MLKFTKKKAYNREYYEVTKEDENRSSPNHDFYYNATKQEKRYVFDLGEIYWNDDIKQYEYWGYGVDVHPSLAELKEIVQFIEGLAPVVQEE